jgi:hypothetical protein
LNLTPSLFFFFPSSFSPFSPAQAGLSSPSLFFSCGPAQPVSPFSSARPSSRWLFSLSPPRAAQLSRPSLSAQPVSSPLPPSLADRRGPPVRVIPDLRRKSGSDSHPSPAWTPAARSPGPTCLGAWPPYLKCSMP